MKAEYVKPYVNIEVFAANNAVAANTCNPGEVSAGFFCLRGPTIDIGENILSSAYLSNTCKGDDETDVGWLASSSANPYYSATAQSAAKDDPSSSDQDIGNRLFWDNELDAKLTDNDEKGTTLSVKNDYRDGFLGWLYYSGETNYKDNWKTNIDSGVLTYVGSAVHAMVIGLWSNPSTISLPS